MPLDAAVDSAVLLVGHGTASSLGDIPEFLRRIRHGRDAPPELSEEVTRRYSKIGGSPLLDVTRALARKLEARAARPCHVAMRFWDPLVTDVVAGLCEGASPPKRLCVLPLSPYSVPLYTGVVREALPRSGHAPEVVPVAPYGESSQLVRAHWARIAPFVASKRREDTALILTAHSLPMSVIRNGDRYAAQFEASARAVGQALDWPIEIAYQSVGAGGGEWLGPSIADVLSRAQKTGRTAAVVAPVGFLADHLETLYDLDVEAAALAIDLGLSFERVPALNDDDMLVLALDAVVRQALS